MNLIYDPFQCISTIALVKNEGEVLDSPIWIMLINIVALEMLGAKMPKPTGLYWYLDPAYYSPRQMLNRLLWSLLLLLLHNPWLSRRTRRREKPFLALKVNGTLMFVAFHKLTNSAEDSCGVDSSILLSAVTY